MAIKLLMHQTGMNYTQIRPCFSTLAILPTVMYVLQSSFI